MKFIGKRSQSEIIVTILLVLLVLAAIVVVWSVVRRIIQQGAGEIDVDILSVLLTIEKNSVYLDYSADTLQFTVSRGADKTAVASIKIVVLGEDNGGNAKSYMEIREKNIPAPLEAVTYVVNIFSLKDDSITKLTVYPVSPKGRVGPASSYIIKSSDKRIPIGGSASDEEYGTTEGGEVPIPESDECEGSEECDDTSELSCINDDVYQKVIENNCVGGICVIGDTNQTLDTDCQEATPHCSNGVCVECISGSDCTNDPLKTRCENNVCVFPSLSSCGTISTPGVYVLINDILSPPAGSCFLISNNNITIDGKGYTITATEYQGAIGYYGISASNKKNINITNLKIRNFQYGITFSGVNNSYISNVDSSYSIRQGIYLLRSSSNNLTNNILTFNGYEGIQLDTYSQNNYLTGNTARNNMKDGIMLSYQCNGNKIENNFACNNNQEYQSSKDFRCATSSGNYGTGNTFGTVAECTGNPVWPLFPDDYDSCPI